MNRHTPIDTATMLAELSNTFPNLRVRALSDSGGIYAGAKGIWTGEDPKHVMPDGLPIFCGLAYGDEYPEYDCYVHTGFSAWLASRGWYAERDDGDVYILVPDVLPRETWE